HNMMRPLPEDKKHGETGQALHGIEWLGSEERTNYPFALSVEDYGHALGVTAHVVNSLSPDRVCAFMQRALEGLAEALECSPQAPIRTLDILSDEERRLLLETWNQTAADYPSEKCIHELFEEQVAKTPE
ncbi:hypothetical protein IB267_33060, partial [Ensifer sp. ENS09]|uniref:hypothetical protein n=1 Tax=Ensifer sp. ENS09 TaxID=2769263 RepID=UPI0017869BB6